MEFNAQRQYRPSSSTSLAMSQSSPTSAQMMYPYAAYPPQRQQQQQQQHQIIHDMSRPSPPQTTWAVPQTHNGYYAMPNGSVVGSREESGHLMASSNAATPRLPTFSSAAYSSDMNGTAPATSTEYFPSVIDTTPWGPKVYEDLDSFHAFDPESSEFNRELMGQDENTPIIDLRQYPRLNQQEPESMPNFNQQCARRMSESSFSISSTGGGVFPEGSTYEDVNSSEPVAYAPECDTWNNMEPNTNHLMSPLASPRKPHYDNLARGGSRSRVSPVPHNNARSSPYTLESTRFKRWSTGQAPTSTPANARAMMNTQDRFAPYGPRANPHHSMPAYPSGAMSHYGMPSQNVLYSQNQSYHHGNPSFFAPQDQSYQLDVPRPLPSQGLFRLLQSNVDRHGGCSSHFADLSDPPDLYSSLHEEPSNPPESDMNPSDPELTPHEQDLRFTGDLYTPRWVRGHGNKREGWCGLCKPGRWLVLKNSAFWYDKSFTHGVSAATGAAFQGPQDTRRTEGNLDVWEGLCGSCGEWIALVSSKKKGTTWFRHAYKCHTHPKVKDGPKRRREAQAGRIRAVSSASAASPLYSSKIEGSQADKTANRHSTPTPIPGSSSLRSYGMPTSTPTSTASLSTPPYPSSNSYPTPSSVTPLSVTPLVYPPHTPTATTAMPSLQTPTTTSFAENRPTSSSSKQDHVLGMFATPLQSFQNMSGSYSASPALSLAHQVSEPELVGVRTTATALNSIASMI